MPLTPTEMEDFTGEESVLASTKSRHYMVHKFLMKWLESRQAAGTLIKELRLRKEKN